MTSILAELRREVMVVATTPNNPLKRDTMLRTVVASAKRAEEDVNPRKDAIPVMKTIGPK